MKAPSKTKSFADSQPALISLYSGAGGLDYGFEAAGFRTAVAVEMDHDCCETLRHNRRWPVIERDIFQIPTSEMLAFSGCTGSGDVDLVIGGPPCQPFSKSGYWATGDSARLSDPRADTLSAYLRVVEDTLPRALLLENVEGLAYANKNEGLRLLLDRIARINKRTGARYRPIFAILRAADFGVPQIRERFFLVASRDGIPFTFPAPTYADLDPHEPQLQLGTAEPYRTAWDALADVVVDESEDLSLRGKWAELLPSIPEGNNYLWHTNRGGGLPLFGWRRRFWCFLLKLAKNRPSWTIQAQPGPATGPFHWNNRRLSMRELCRLQTFPDDVHVIGTRTSIQKQVGNAVPSLLAEVLARAIRAQFLDGASRTSPPTLLPPRRLPVPSAEPVAAVPRRYRKLRGEHSPHPGTGHGFRASKRANVDLPQ